MRRKLEEPDVVLFRKTPVQSPAAAAPTSTAPGPTIMRLGGDRRALEFEAQLARGQWQEFHDFLEGTTD